MCTIEIEQDNKSKTTVVLFYLLVIGHLAARVADIFVFCISWLTIKFPIQPLYDIICPFPNFVSSAC